MKKIIFVFLMLFVLCGCNEEINTEEPKEINYGLSSLVPDPETMFENSGYELMDADVGPNYQFILHNGDREMFKEYVNACQNGTFTTVITDLETYFKAESNDGLYSVSVSFFPGTDNSDGYVYVAVKYLDETEE